MIAKELEAKILRLYHAEKWRVGTIADQLGIHHDVVERVLEQDGVPQAERAQRPSIVDPYLPFMLKTLEAYPRLRASRLYEMVKERGYTGQPDHFRHVIAKLRPKPPAEAYLRLRTLPGEHYELTAAMRSRTRHEPSCGLSICPERS